MVRCSGNPGRVTARVSHWEKNSSPTVIHAARWEKAGTAPQAAGSDLSFACRIAGSNARARAPHSARGTLVEGFRDVENPRRRQRAVRPVQERTYEEAAAAALHQHGVVGPAGLLGGLGLGWAEGRCEEGIRLHNTSAGVSGACALSDLASRRQAQQPSRVNADEPRAMGSREGRRRRTSANAPLAEAPPGSPAAPLSASPHVSTATRATAGAPPLCTSARSSRTVASPRVMDGRPGAEPAIGWRSGASAGRPVAPACCC